MPYTIETGEPSRPYDTLKWTILEEVDTHTQNTGVDTGQTTNMETTHRNRESKMQLNLLNHLAGTQWAADQSNLLRVDKMLVLSAVKSRSVAYTSARKTQLKKLDPIQNKGLLIAMGAFCINQNL
jgi:hypothetical protein